MTHDTRNSPSTVDAAGEKTTSAAGKRYTPPDLTEYGDIATLTLTGGHTRKDTGTKKQRIG